MPVKFRRPLNRLDEVGRARPGGRGFGVPVTLFAGHVKPKVLSEILHRVDETVA